MKIRVGLTEIGVNLPDMAALQAAVGDRLARGEGFALATLNLDHLVKLRHDQAFRAAYVRQDLITADGNPIVWMARLAGDPLTVLPGSDLILPLLRLAAQAGVGVGLVGSTDVSLAGAADALRRAVPDLRIVALIAPPMGFQPDGAAADAVLDQLAAQDVRLCLLALGAPKQEVFAARGRLRTPGIGFASIGAGLDFLSGQQARAPVWVRRLALEWLWRLLSDPRRLALRYLRCAAILPGHLLAAWRQRVG